MIVAVARVRESANTSLCDNKGISVDAKISLNVGRREVSPACIAGVYPSDSKRRAQTTAVVVAENPDAGLQKKLGCSTEIENVGFGIENRHALLSVLTSVYAVP